MNDWKNYVNVNGDFELPMYIYRSLNELMKTCLDMGTLLCDTSKPEGSRKLRAYKEQTKNIFKKRWLEIAEALESFDIISACGCEFDEYCRVCGGSRYRLNEALTADQMRDVGVIIGAGQTNDLAEKLQRGLMKALKEIDTLELSAV